MAENIVTASSYELMKQAADTAVEYYDRIATSMDKACGKGWSAQHPEAVARLAQTAALDYQAALLVKGMEKVGGQIAAALSALER